MPSAGAGSPAFAGTLSGRSLRLPRARRPTRGREVVSEAVTRQRGDPARARRPHETIPFEHPSRFRTLRECRFALASHRAAPLTALCRGAAWSAQLALAPVATGLLLRANPPRTSRPCPPECARYLDCLGGCGRPLADRGASEALPTV